MILSEKETTVIKDLQTQEQCCVEKYERYSKLAKDQVLIDLFTDLHGKEQKHLESLTQVLSGKVPSCDCNDSDGKDYNPALPTAWHLPRIRKRTVFLQQTVSEQKNLFLPLTIRKCLHLVIRVSENFWQTFRSKNRTMRRCFINIKQSIAWRSPEFRL